MYFVYILKWTNYTPNGGFKYWSRGKKNKNLKRSRKKSTSKNKADHM